MGIILALLKGVNVSGHKKILMADLKALFEEAGFKNITTYIQSGNIVFENHQLPLAELPQLIATKIQERYNFDVPVITRTVAEMENVLIKTPGPTTKYRIKINYT